MSLIITPVVEGHGEVEAIPLLLRRIWYELLSRGDSIHVLTPIRRPRGLLVTPDGRAAAGLSPALELARMKTQQFAGPADARQLVLLVIDSEGLCPSKTAAALLNAGTPSMAGMRLAVVLANVMYETWFVASAASLSGFFAQPEVADPAAEQNSRGKGWIKGRFAGNYSETVDQVRMTASMSLPECQANSRSFRKLLSDIQSAAGL